MQMANQRLRDHESTGPNLKQQLAQLQQSCSELAQAASCDEICRLAVGRGRQFLGFQRISLWMRQAQTLNVKGSFGVDEEGNIRDERGVTLTVPVNSPMGQVLSRQKSLLIELDCPLRNERGQEVGRGVHVLAALWNGAEVIGCLCLDNLLEPQRAMPESGMELLKLYAFAVSQVINRKQLGEALQRSEAKAAAANRSKNFVLAGMGHEIRTPMNAIIGFTDLALKSGLNETPRRYLEIVRDRSRDLLKLINDLMDPSLLKTDCLVKQPVIDPPGGSRVMPAAPAQRQLHILVVEDDGSSKLLLQLLLEELGHCITLADSGEEALQILAANDFDLVLMDINLPGMDGLETARQLRNPSSPERNQKVPVIAMTANAMPPDQSACLEAGMNHFIAKPIFSHDLTLAIERLVE